MKNRFFHVFVAAACFIFAVTALGLVNGTSSLYVKPICDDLGFSRGAFSFTFSIMLVFFAISSFFFGLINKNIGVRNIFIIGVVCAAGAYTLFSFAKNLYMFYAGGALLGIGCAYTGTLPISVVVNNWFMKNKGTVLGIILAGGGIGGAVLNPLVGRWINENGWRISYINSVITVVIICVPSLLVLRNKPSDVGLAAYGAGKGNCENGAPSTTLVSGFSLSEARKTDAFWYFMIAQFLLGFSIQPVYVHSSAHLSQVGLTPQIIALIASIVYCSTTFAKVFLGIINDRFGVKYIIIISNLFFVTAAVCLILAKTSILGFAFGTAFGVAYTMLSMVTSIAVEKLFGQKDYGNLLGILVAIQTVGSSVGTVAVGYSFDAFHTYRYGFTMEAVLDILAVCLVLTALFKISKVHGSFRQESVIHIK